MRKVVGVSRYIAGFVGGWMCWGLLCLASPVQADALASSDDEGGQSQAVMAGDREASQAGTPASAASHDVHETDEKVTPAPQDKTAPTQASTLKGVMGLVEGGSAEQKLQERLRILSSARQALEARKRVLHETMSAFSESIDNRKIVPQEAVERLVGIYEAMNPKEAAAVFNVMDPHVLIALSAGMNIRKLSAVMAHMTPDRVNLVSQYLVGVRHFHNLGEGFSAFIAASATGPEGGASSPVSAGASKPLAVIQYKPMTKSEPLLPSRQ